MNSKRPPILLSGLILGLFGLANLLLNYHSIFFYFLNGLALILWLYLTLALVLSFSDYRQDYCHEWALALPRRGFLTGPAT